jgi:hypothetical protein
MARIVKRELLSEERNLNTCTAQKKLNAENFFGTMEIRNGGERYTEEKNMVGSKQGKGRNCM